MEVIILYNTYLTGGPVQWGVFMIHRGEMPPGHTGMGGGGVGGGDIALTRSYSSAFVHPYIFTVCVFFFWQSKRNG